MTAIRLVTEPTVLVLAEQALNADGLNKLLDWVSDYRPECVPDDLPGDANERAMALFPHDGREGERTLTDNEKIVELAGRNCYLSYGLKAGRKSNAEHIDATGSKSTGLDRKRIYEAAAGLLPMQACTSMVWTTNPMALSKLFRERCDQAADREFQRFARAWRDVACARWPNLFAVGD